MTTSEIYNLIGSRWQAVLLGTSAIYVFFWVRSSYVLVNKSQRGYY